MSEGTEAGPELPREARKWAMIVHIISLVGLLGNGIGFLLGPLIVWMVKKEDHPFVDEQGRRAINFQITMLLVILVCVGLSLVLIGIPLLILAAIIMTVMPIIAAIKANDGEHYKYPFAIRFLKED